MEANRTGKIYPLQVLVGGSPHFVFFERSKKWMNS